MISTLRFLRVAYLPLLDVLEADEALFDTELTVILFKLVHLLEHACLCGIALLHAHSNPIWTDIACTKYVIMFLFCHKWISLIRWDHREIDSHSWTTFISTEEGLLWRSHLSPHPLLLTELIRLLVD